MSIGIFNSKIIQIIPALSTSPAYTSGDQMGVVNTISQAVNSSFGTGMIVSVTGIDKAKVNCNFDILFFSQSPTLTSVDNAALSISDAEMASKFIGRLSVTTYVSTAVNSDFTVPASSAGLKIKAGVDTGVNGAGSGSRDIYCVLQASATAGGAYSSVSDLVINISIDQD